MTTTRKRRTVIKDVPIEETIERLERETAAFEQRYKRSSEQALADVRSGQMRETAEIAKWLIAHRVLKDLREALTGHTTGQL